MHDIKRENYGSKGMHLNSHKIFYLGDYNFAWYTSFPHANIAMQLAY